MSELALKQGYDEEDAQERFFDYCQAKSFAEATGSFVDAKLAGQAWVRFLNVFAPAEYQMEVGNLVRFPLEERNPPEGYFDD